MYKVCSVCLCASTLFVIILSILFMRLAVGVLMSWMAVILFDSVHVYCADV